MDYDKTGELYDKADKQYYDMELIIRTLRQMEIITEDVAETLLGYLSGIEITYADIICLYDDEIDRLTETLEETSSEKPTITGVETPKYLMLWCSYCDTDTAIELTHASPPYQCSHCGRDIY